MNRHKPVLHVCPCAHLLGRAEQHPHFAASDLAEQLLFLCIGRRFMDETHLLGGDATGNQLLSDVIVHVESAVIFRCGEVAEQ